MTSSYNKFGTYYFGLWFIVFFSLMIFFAVLQFIRPMIVSGILTIFFELLWAVFYIRYNKECKNNNKIQR